MHSLHQLALATLPIPRTGVGNGDSLAHTAIGHLGPERALKGVVGGPLAELRGVSYLDADALHVAELLVVLKHRFVTVEHLFSSANVFLAIFILLFLENNFQHVIAGNFISLQDLVGDDLINQLLGHVIQQAPVTCRRLLLREGSLRVLVHVGPLLTLSYLIERYGIIGCDFCNSIYRLRV